MLSVSYSSNVREFPVILNSVDTKVVFEFVYCIIYYVMFIVCVCNVFPDIFSVYNCISNGYDCIVKLWFMSCFHIWVSILMVNVRTNFLVLVGSDNSDIVNICCNGVYYFFVRLL